MVRREPAIQSDIRLDVRHGPRPRRSGSSRTPSGKGRRRSCRASRTCNGRARFRPRAGRQPRPIRAWCRPAENCRWTRSGRSCFPILPRRDWRWSRRAAPVRPQAAEPPLPVRIAPSTEPSARRCRRWSSSLPGSRALAEKCISPRDLKSIRKITADISVKPEDLTGRQALAAGMFVGRHAAASRVIGDRTPLPGRRPAPATIRFTSKTSNWSGTATPGARSSRRRFRRSSSSPRCPCCLTTWAFIRPTSASTIWASIGPAVVLPTTSIRLPLSVRGALYEGTFLGLLPVAL